MGKVIRNILRGFGSVGTVLPVETNLPSITVRKISIEDAMREDWQHVGGDIQAAMRKFESAHGKAKQTR